MKARRHTLASITFAGMVLFGSIRTMAAPTSVSVTNSSAQAVYATLVLGQPQTVPPPNCTNLGKQIRSISDPMLVFKSSVPNKVVKFTPQAPGITTKGYYKLAPKETITYQPQTFPCGASTCSPAMTFNFFFTPSPYNGSPNNGCGGSPTFPNATNLAEASINFGINGSQGTACANADAADISVVNGLNAQLSLQMTGSSWPISSASNAKFGKNANRQGVYGWAATTCVNNAGYPNPSATCAVPKDAPKAPSSGQCTTPGGTTYAPIVDPKTGAKYCDERSDASTAFPQGQCLSRRPGNVTGGQVAITFSGFMK